MLRNHGLSCIARAARAPLAAAIFLVACSGDGGATTEDGTAGDPSTGSSTGAVPTSGPTSGPSGETTAETASETTGAGEPATGRFERIDLMTAADVLDVFSPRAGLAFFATPSGVLRLADGVLSEVDLGCDCIVTTFDRESGFAAGVEGPELFEDTYLVYAGVFDGKDGFKPFAWETGRNGPMPLRVWGDGEAFVYTAVNGYIRRYHPTAVLGSASFAGGEPWGDAIVDTGRFRRVWGRGPDDYYLTGSSGVYHRQGVFEHVFMDAMGQGFRALDIWGQEATVWALASDGIHVSANNGPMALQFKVDAQEDERLVGAWFGEDRWVLGLRRDGGNGTGADPFRMGAFLVHDDGGAARRIDFPQERDLQHLAVNEAELYLAGPAGAAYVCRLPDCDLPEAAPMD